MVAHEYWESHTASRFRPLTWLNPVNLTSVQDYVHKRRKLLRPCKAAHSKITMRDRSHLCRCTRGLRPRKQSHPKPSASQLVRKHKTDLLLLALTLAIFAVQEYQYGIGQRILESEISASSRVNADIARGGQGHLQQRPDGTYAAALERAQTETVHLQACVQVVITRANGTVESPMTSC